MNKPLYFVGPRDIYDALYSSSVKASLEFLHYFLIKRGHFLGGKYGREELCDYISKLPLCYHDIEEISKQIEPSSRREKKTAKRITTEFCQEDFAEAIDKVNRFRGDHINESINLVIDNGKPRVKVSYVDSNLGLTVLRQNKPREEFIEIIQNKNELKLEFSDNPRVGEVVASLIAELEEIDDGIKTTEVDLSTFDKKERTRFFKELIGSIPGFTYHDVIKVNVDYVIAKPDFFSEEVSVEDFEASGESADSAFIDSEIKVKTEEEVKSFLRKAALDGSGILHSKHLDDFLMSGFYLSRIVWQSIKNDKHGAKVEFEAFLKRPAEGSGFIFNIRGQYNRKKDGSFNITRMSSGKDESAYLDMIENVAIGIQSKITNERAYSGEVEII